MNNNNKKKKNPLYVITNNGQDVESAHNIIEVLFKKMGIDFIYKFIIDYIQALLQTVKSYPMLVEINKVLEQFIAMLMKVSKSLPF